MHADGRGLPRRSATNTAMHQMSGFCPMPRAVEPGGHPRQTSLTRPSPNGAPLADALSREAYRKAKVDQ